MLVLSRRQSDQVVFPNLGIRVHVVRIDGKTVRLGIDAPRDVQVLRNEIAEDPTKWNKDAGNARPKKLGHELRNRLNSASLGLHLLHRKLEAGQLDGMESTIFKVFRELSSMEREVARIGEDGTVSNNALPRKALLVDDSRNESELLAGYLRTCNFDVDLAQDGEDALAYLADHEEKPDVVLLDMNMPRMDGPTTVHEIRSNPVNAGLRLFAVSGLSSEEAGIEVGPGGVDRWFQKPIRPDALVGAIERELSAAAV